jgi:hypothetical protein
MTYRRELGDAMGPRTYVKRGRERVIRGGHLLRRRAQERADRLNEALVRQRQNDRIEGKRISEHGEVFGYASRWLAQNGYPEWTQRFEVRRARTRVHYRIWAVGE